MHGAVPRAREWIATPAFKRGRCQARTPSRSASTASTSVAKRRWSGRSAGCANRRVRTAPQQREADAGGFGGIGQRRLIASVSG